LRYQCFFIRSIAASADHDLARAALLFVGQGVPRYWAGGEDFLRFIET
jgi:hypothetical protein